MKAKVLIFLKNNSYLLIGLFLILIVFNAWVFNFGIISDQDWHYKFQETAKSIFLQRPFLLNPDAYGSQNLTMSNYPLLLAWGILSTFLSFEIIERLLYLWPALILGSLGIYKLVELITSSKKAGLLGILIYMLNSYVVVLGFAGHFTILVGYAITPLVIYFFEKLLKEQKVSYIVASSIALIALGIYEFRILYIVLFLLSARAIYFVIALKKLTIKFCILTIIPFIAVILFNLPWLIGLSQTNSLTTNELLSQSLFGSQYLNIIYAFTLNHPFWNTNEIVYFENQQVTLTNLMFPLLAFLALLIKKNRVIKWFWVGVAIVGILLVKQLDFPVGGIYEWLFNNLPGFSAFREASKFFLLIALSYSILISTLISQQIIFNKKLRIENIIFISILLILLVNVFSVFTGKYGSNYKSVNIPDEYLEIEKIIKSDNSSFNTLWIPSQSHWTYFTQSKPSISFGYYFDKFVLAVNPKTPNYNDMFKVEYKKIFTSILENSGVKYIVIVNNREELDRMGIDYDIVINAFESNSKFEKVKTGNENLFIYKLNTSKQKIYTTANTYAIQSLEELDKLMEFNKTIKDSNFIANGSKVGIGVGNLSNVVSETSLIESKFITNDQIGEGIVKIYKRTDIQKLNIQRIRNTLSFFTNSTGYLYQNNSELFNPEEEKQELFNLELDSTGRYFLKLDKDYYYLADGLKELGIVGELNYPKEIKVLKFANENIYNPSTRYLEEDLKGLSLSEFYSYEFQNPVKKYKSKEVQIDDIEFNLNPTEFRNLVNNGSFEEGSWQNQVSDCNNTDNNPVIALGLDKQAKAGIQSVRLEAQRHTACISTEVNINKPGNYMLSFWYKSENAIEAGFYLGFGDDSVQRKLKINNTEWNNYYEYINIPSGISKIDLTIYSFSTNEKDNIVTLYDDFRVFDVSEVKDLYYIEESNKNIEVPNIDLIKSNPTYYKFNVDNLNSNFSINFNNNYSDDWKLKARQMSIKGERNEYLFSDEIHLKSTIGLNIWLVNVDNLCGQLDCSELKSIEFVIEYIPQRNINNLYNMVTVLVCGSGLFYSLKKVYHLKHLHEINR